MKMTMRKLLAILATLAMLCTVLPLGTLFSAMADEANLFVNGDFETGNADGWRTWQSTEIIADAAHSGSYGAHLVGNGGWGGMLDQTIAVEAGKEYKLSFWINVNAMGCNVQVKDGAGNAIENAGGWFDANKKDHTVEWTFTATDDSVFVNFCGSGNQPEDVYVDDFKLVCLSGGDEPEAPATNNPIKNYDFETGDLTGWNNLWGSCTVSFVEGYNSANALKIECGQWQQVRQNGLKVEANTDYILSADIKDAVNFTLLTKKGDDSGNIKEVAIPNSSEWANYELAFNTGDQTEICVLLMGNEAGASAIVDNVVLTKVGGGDPVEPPVTPDEPVANNIIKNGDFADGTNGWSASGACVLENDNGALHAYMNDDWSFINAGTYNLKANTNYKLTFKAKAINGGTITPKMNKADWSGTVVEQKMNFTGEWANYEWAFTTTDVTSYMVFFQSGHPASAKQEVWLDDVVLVEVTGGDTPVDPEPPVNPDPEPPVTPDPEPVDPNFDGYLYNGDFETGALTEGWKLTSGSGLSGFYADAAKDGKYGFKLEGDPYGEILFSHPIPQTLGATYTIEFDAKLLSRGDFNFQVKKCPSDDPSKGNNFLNEYVNNGVVDEWKHYSFSFTVEEIMETREYFSIMFVVNQNADFCIDNIVVTSDIEPEQPELPEGVLANDTFDDETLGIWDSTSDLINDNGALKFSPTQDWGNFFAEVEVEPNTDYEFKFKAKSSLGKNLWVKFNKAWAADVAQETVKSTTDWAEYTYTLNSGDNTSLIILFQYAGYAADGESFWFDYISIAKTGTDIPVEPPVTPDEPVGNLIVNGDFETGNADGWVVYSDTAATADAAKNGSYGVMTQGAGDWGGLLNQTIAVKAGEEYTLSFWVKAVKNGVNVQIKQDDWQGASIEDAGAGYYSNTEWKYVENTFVAPTDTIFINVCGSGIQSTDCVYFDDFKLVKPGSDVPPADGVLYEEGFENGVDGWQIEGEGGVGVYTEDAHSGNSSLIVRGDFMEDYDDLAYSPTTALKAGNEYTLTFWVKSLKKGATGFSVIYRQNADRTGELGDFQALTWPTFETEWTQKTYILRPEVDGYVGLNFIRVNADILVDDISIVQTGGGDSTDTNVLLNGGFENGADSWQLADGMATIVDDARTGKGALQLSNVGLWAGAALQTVPVKPNTNYVIELWYKREVGTKPFNLYVMNGETNANLERAEGSGDNWFNTADSDWTQRNIIVNTGDATTMTLKWSAETVNDGIMLIDDMMVYPEGERPGEPEALNPIVNGGFETGDLTGWINLWNACTVNFVAPGHDNSKHAIEVITNGSWQQVRQDMIPVEPNTDYVVEAYVRNSNNMGIVIKEGYDSFDLTAFEVGQIADDNSNTWKKHVFEFNTGKDKDGNDIDPIDSICLLIISPDAGSSVEIDNVKLFKKSEYGSNEYAGPIVNSGFETGDLSSWTNLWDSCTVAFEAPGRNDSKFALDFSAGGQWKQVRQDKIPVEPNTDYVLVAHSKNANNVNVVVKTEDDSTNIADFGVPNDVSNKWVRHEIAFNSGAESKVSVLLITNNEAGGAALWDDVQIFKAGEVPAPEEPTEPEVTEGPVKLDYYTMANNRPTTPEANLILNGSFEDAEPGQWGAIDSEFVSIVDDATAPNGNKSLFYNTSGKENAEKLIFYVDVEQNTDYVFSAWVKGAFISDDNRFQATFGVIDYKQRFAVYEDHVFSNTERQIVPPAWDNEWHLRSVGFNSGANVKIGIAITGGFSQMWLDDIALFKVDEGIKYTGAKQTSYIIASPLYAEEGGCADEHNILPDANMNGDEIKEFWASAEGYKNGFLSFAENKYEYGTSLKYTASEKAVGTYAIKWLEVKPNTTYTFSIDMRILESGAGKFLLLDGKKRECYPFLMVDFDKEGYGADWFTVAVEFNTGVFDRIGLAVADGGGEALLDNMRLFESVNRAEVEDDYITPPAGGETPDEPGSPDTGVAVFGAAVAMALVPSAAAVALKLRRKKEDEE